VVGFQVVVRLFLIIIYFFGVPLVVFIVFHYFFFFSSRRRHTRFSRDWSSDVCSSDLRSHHLPAVSVPVGSGDGRQRLKDSDRCRSEERRVGKECRSRWSAYH